jgi:LacI family transcriptional regulator
VSRSTVSLVLQKHPRIPEETANKVRKSMDALGYTYNRNAANLRQRTSQAIGLVINDIRNPFFAQLTSAVEETAAKAGYMVYLAESAEEPARQDRVLDSFVEHNVAGVIVCAATGTPARAFDRFLARADLHGRQALPGPQT